MASLSPDVSAALASLRTRWGAAAPAGDRLARDFPWAGRRGASRRAAGGPHGRPAGHVVRRPATAGRLGPSDHDRFRRARRDPRTGRGAPRCGGRPVRRSIERSDDPRPAARRRGPGQRLDRRLGGPCPEPGSGRGGCPGSSPGMARRPRASLARRRDRDGRIAPRRAVGRRPRGRPAGGRPGARTQRSAAKGGSTTGQPSTETLTEPGQSPRTPGCARPAGRCPAHRPRAAGARAGAGSRRGLVDSAPARAGPSIVDPARPGCRRPAHRGGRRSEPVRPNGPSRGAPDPVRGRREPGRLPPARFAPRRSPWPGRTRCRASLHGRARGDRSRHGHHHLRPHRPAITDS